MRARAASAATTSSASGTAAASPIPPRLRVARISTQAPGSAKSANQASPFGMCLLEWWPISCASTTRTSASENVPSTIVLQSTTWRDGAEADGVGVRLARRAAHVLDRDRDARDALLPLELLRGALRSAGSSSGVVVGHEVRLRERERRPDRDEHGRARESTRSRRAAGRGTSRRGARCRSRRTRRRARTSGRTPTRGSPPRSGRTAAPTRRRASVNGSSTSQTIPSPSMPRSIPVPIGPAADSRAKRGPRRA